MERLLKKAQQTRRPIEIIYQGCDGSITQRMIVVKRITSTHILAYCAMRKQYRQFEINRILAVANKQRKETVMSFR